MPKPPKAARLMKKLPLHHRFGYRLNMINAALGQHTLLRLQREFGLNLAEYRVMNALAAFDAPSIRDIAKHSQMDKAHVTLSLAALIKRGLATQKVDPHDRRLRVVELTDAGWRLAASFAPFQLERQKRMERRVSGSELRIFWKVMDALSEEVEQILAEEEQTMAPSRRRKMPALKAAVASSAKGRTADQAGRATNGKSAGHSKGAD